MLIGSLLLANPEIEQLIFAASLFLAAGLMPYGISLLRYGDRRVKPGGNLFLRAEQD